MVQTAFSEEKIGQLTTDARKTTHRLKTTIAMVSKGQQKGNKSTKMGFVNFRLDTSSSFVQ